MHIFSKFVKCKSFAPASMCQFIAKNPYRQSFPFLFQLKTFARQNSIDWLESSMMTVLYSEQRARIDYGDTKRSISTRSTINVQIKAERLTIVICRLFRMRMTRDSIHISLYS